MHLDPLWELWKQLRLWLGPTPCVYVPTKPTAAKARPVSAAGALICLDVLQALNLQSCQRGCKSVVHTAIRRDFSCSFIVARPLGLSCVFSPTSACGLPTHLCLLLRLPPGHVSLPRREGAKVATRARKSTQAGAPPSACGGRGWCMGKGCSGSPTLHAPLSHGAAFLWRPRFLPRTFLVEELLTPIPSGCLFAANSSPLPGSALQTPRSSPQPPSAPADTRLRLGSSGLWHAPSV